MKINVDKSELKESIKICCVYKITNDVNGKVYIGQTTNFRKRISDYKNIEKRKTGSRPIGIAVKEYGKENFSVDIIKRCKPDELDYYELYYIKEYKADNPEFGYNVVTDVVKTQNTAESRKKKSIAHLGLKESASTKRKKSNMILAIPKDDERTIIICESGKIFGDFVGKSKDMIKNCLRQPSSCNGYRLYYDDYEKRQDVRKKMMSKRCVRDKDYMKILDTLDWFEKKEGVETMYMSYDIYLLSYDHVDKNGIPVPQYVSNGASAMKFAEYENDTYDF